MFIVYVIIFFSTFVTELYKNGIQNIMQNNLVIVESPAKAKTIEKFLGEGYKVLSSYGHIRDLKQKAFSIDIKSHFKPITKYRKIRKTGGRVEGRSCQGRHGMARIR